MLETIIAALSKFKQSGQYEADAVSAAKECGLPTWRFWRLFKLTDDFLFDADRHLEEALRISGLEKTEYQQHLNDRNWLRSPVAVTALSDSNPIPSQTHTHTQLEVSMPTSTSGVSYSKSSVHNPCPVCGRTHDDGCQMADDGKTVLCRSKAHNGQVPEPPDMVGDWKFTGKINTEGVLERAVYVNAAALSKKTERVNGDYTFYYPTPDQQPLVRCRRIDKEGGKKIPWQEFWIEDDRLSAFRVQGNWVKLSDKDKKEGKASKEQFTVYTAHRNALMAQVHLYRIDEALSLHQGTGRPLLIVEGEPTVDKLLVAGLPATTAIGGAKKFAKHYGFENYPSDLKPFGQNIVICPDCDEDGREHANQIEFVLSQMNVQPKWLYAGGSDHSRWSGEKWAGGYDLKDWLVEGARMPDILAAIGEQKVVVPQFQDVVTNAGGKIEKVKWDNVPHSNRNGTHLFRWEMKGSGDDRHPVEVPIADFNFVIERILQSHKGGGYVLMVSRLVQGRTCSRRAVVQSQQDCGKPVDFALAIKRELGVNVSFSLKPDELQSLLAVRTEQYYENGGRVYRLIDRIGQQDDGTWVTDGMQFTANGVPTTEEETGWVFNSRLSEDDYIPHPVWRQPDKQALPNLMAAARGFFLHEDSFMRFLLDCGWVAACVQFQKIMEEDGAFPLLNVHGDRACGKTVSMMAALSLVGWQKQGDNSGVFAKTTLSALYERLKFIGSLPLFWDDPPKGNKQHQAEMDEMLKGLYNGSPRVVRGNTQRPYTSLALATNHTLGDDSPATRSRLIQRYVPKRELGDTAAYDLLQQAMKQASGCFSDLIQLGYNSLEVSQLERELAQHMPKATQRVEKSLAQNICFAEKIARAAGVDVDVRAWAIKYLCPSENEANTAEDSLGDFLQKLSVLQSSGAIGEWNCREIETRQGERYLAVCLNSVWAELEKAFPVIYAKATIKHLVVEQGGRVDVPQKFAISADLQRSYEQKMLVAGAAAYGGISEPAKVSRRALLIPIELASEFLDPKDEDETEPTPEPAAIQDVEVAQAVEPIQSEVEQVEPEPAPEQGEWVDVAEGEALEPGTRVIEYDVKTGRYFEQGVLVKQEGCEYFIQTGSDPTIPPISSYHYELRRWQVFTSDQK